MGVLSKCVARNEVFLHCVLRLRHPAEWIAGLVFEHHFDLPPRPIAPPEAHAIGAVASYGAADRLRPPTNEAPHPRLLWPLKVRYVPLCLATGTCPRDQQSFFLQQYRWCLGILTLVRSDGFWGSGISCMNKLCFFNGLLYYLAPALVRGVLILAVTRNSGALLDTFFPR